MSSQKVLEFETPKIKVKKSILITTQVDFVETLSYEGKILKNSSNCTFYGLMKIWSTSNH
jgi:hypothetical protein